VSDEVEAGPAELEDLGVEVAEVHREALAVRLLGAPGRRDSVPGAAEPGALH
jgi:hypothetical protein